MRWIAGLELDPGYSPGYLQLGRLCRRLHQEESALQVFHSGIRLTPKAAELWRETGTDIPIPGDARSGSASPVDSIETGL